ncbi:MAG TPA: hypothetical protein VM598_12870 [Bdellovibrionota bacterium]|nr:hypothetical protein [Bdellovibrionota bacterium]
MTKLILSALLVCSSALAAAPTFDIVTIDGQTVKVSEEALRRAYDQLVTTSSNQTSTLEDGSTAVMKPSTMIAGVLHTIAADTRFAQDYGSGLCKLRGFQKATAGEIDWTQPQGPVVILTTSGQVVQTFAVAPTWVRGFRLLVCR